MQKVFVGCYLSPELFDRLHFACQRCGLTKSEALRQAIELWLEREGGERKERGEKHRGSGFDIRWA